jgi:cell division protein FtsL
MPRGGGPQRLSESRRPGDGRPGRRPAAGPNPRTGRLTSRAAVLAVVLCAVALSLAYPVHEFIAQRKQIGQLEAQHQSLAAQLRQLRAERARLASNAYVEQQARDRLHMCFPAQTCYVVINRHPSARALEEARAARTPWYERLWESVQQANAPVRAKRSR